MTNRFGLRPLADGEYQFHSLKTINGQVPFLTEYTQATVPRNVGVTTISTGSPPKWTLKFFRERGQYLITSSRKYILKDLPSDDYVGTVNTEEGRGKNDYWVIRYITEGIYTITAASAEDYYLTWVDHTSNEIPRPLQFIKHKEQIPADGLWRIVS